MQNLLIYTKERTRRFERRPYEKAIDYSMVVSDPDKQKRLDLKGKIFEISDAGVGIETDYPLLPGHTLLLNDGVNKAGVVRWCTKVNGNYRAGIEFKTDGHYNTHPDEKIKESALFVGEETERYNKLLDVATERFNKELEAIEKRCYDSNESPEELLKATEKTINEMMAICAEFEQGVKDKDSIRNARITFREKTNPIMSKSYCINRTRTWPQGSQGDYKTLEVAYRNTPLSEGIGYYLDLYLLHLPLGGAVRNRIKKLEEILRAEILQRQQPSALNIGCGSCRELMGIAPEIIDSEARIICIDNDNDALAFAQDRLSYAGILPQVELRKYNALRMFDEELNMTEFGKQDIIYSVGLFDYLPSDFLIKMFESLYKLLNPGGKLIAAFKDAARYRHQEFHWLVDWDGFLQRKEEDFRSIFSEAKIPDSAVSEMRENSGIIVFYTITK